MNNAKLILQGAWDQSPMFAWFWFSKPNVESFEKLTGFRIKSFTYLKNGLHYQNFLREDLEKIKSYYQSMAPDGQKDFLLRLKIDLEKQQERIAAEFQSLESEKDLIKKIQGQFDALSGPALDVWFIVWLDQWYPKEDEHIEIKRLAGEVRDKAGRFDDKLKNIIKDELTELAQEKGLDYDSICYLFPEELDDIDKEKIENRKKLFVTTDIVGEYKIYEGENAQRLLDEYAPREGGESANVLKGQIANRGKVTGKARLIFYDKDFPDFKEGEILVSLQTMVYYVPLMKKSSAILTEFGGLTSHAAIVSRELSKPCIVGIKGLTSAIKTGDEIEVDADNGIVRRI